jgi:hypothetical protein
MRTSTVDNESRWQHWDAATYGLIYGCITVLSLLMAMGTHVEEPLRMAGALFGSVVAITLAKAFAEVMADSLDAGLQNDRALLAAAWHHSRPTLSAANVPALLIGAAAFDVLPVDLAIHLSQAFCILLLLLLGGRVGWVVGGRLRSIVGGALFTGGIGFVLGAMKYLIH